MLYLLQWVIFVLTIPVVFYNPGADVWQRFDLTSRVTLKIVIISYAVSAFEGIATKARQLKIINQLMIIDEVICTKFCGDFDNYVVMKRKYLRLIWGVFLGLVVVKIFHYALFNKAPIILACAWSYAHFGISVRLLQNAFYVDMVYERLCILHQELEKLKINGCSKVQQQLNLSMDIYGKLWMITNDLNYSFGWSLLTIILECVVDLVNEINVIYINCDSDTQQCFDFALSKFFIALALLSS